MNHFQSTCRAAVFFILIAACGNPNGDTPGSTAETNSPAVSSFPVEADSSWLKSWYAARGERTDHVAVTADSSMYIGVAVAERSDVPGRRTRVDLWQLSNRAKPLASSAAEEGAWIDTMFVIHQSRQTHPYILAFAEYEDGGSAVQFIIHDGVLEPVVIDPPQGGERFAPAAISLRRRPDQTVCAAQIRWHDAVENNPEVMLWYDATPRGFKVMSAAPVC